MTHPKQLLLTHIAPPPLYALALLSGPAGGGSGTPRELNATLPVFEGEGKVGKHCQALGGLWADHGVSCGRGFGFSVAEQPPPAEGWTSCWQDL